LSARVQGGTRGEHIIHQNEVSADYVRAFAQAEGSAQVFKAGAPI
jgi:hypothetical protein